LVGLKAWSVPLWRRYFGTAEMVVTDMQHVLSVTGVATTPFRLDLQAALPTTGRYLNYRFGKDL